MQDAHYGLQALLYTVALHRYLRWRLADYDPDRHLAGVLYLFLRGMGGADTPVVDGEPCGVFTWQPSRALVARAERRPRPRSGPGMTYADPFDVRRSRGRLRAARRVQRRGRARRRRRSCGAAARRAVRRARRRTGGARRRAGRTCAPPGPRVRRPGDHPRHGDGRHGRAGRHLRAAVAGPGWLDGGRRGKSAVAVGDDGAAAAAPRRVAPVPRPLPGARSVRSPTT